MKLAPYVVGYIDLLGFSEGIMREEEDPSHLMGRSLKFSAMKAMARKIIERVVGGRVEARWLSDTCVFAALIEELHTTQITQALHDVSTAVGVTQCRFACEDYFCRGGIAIGRMTQSVNDDGSHGPRMHGELFGAGVVRAAELEKSVAKHPRVVVSARLAAPATSLRTAISGRSIYSWDIELPYIDYLSFAEALWPERPDQVLAGHAELVHNLVVDSKRIPALRPKAAWLLDYHNSHIESRGALDHLLVKVAIPIDEPGHQEASEESQGTSLFALRVDALPPVQAWRSPSGRTESQGKS